MTLPIENARFDALAKLAAERFGEITPAENNVLRFSVATEDQAPPPSQDRPEVRAPFLHWLATDKEAANHIDPLGLRVADANIPSGLNLAFCKIPFRLCFHRCAFLAEFYLSSAELPALNLFDCTVKRGISGDVLRVQGNVLLRGLNSEAEVRFLGAQIGGNLECSDATLATQGDALSADRAKIAGSVFLTGCFSSSGAIRLVGTQIGDDLDCSGATLTAKSCAIAADRANIAGNLNLKEGFSSSGEVRLLGARIGGNLDCSGAALNGKDYALSADRANIGGTVFLKYVSAPLGAMTLSVAQIGANLDCTRAKLRTLTCENTRIGRDLIWTEIQSPEETYLNLLQASVNTLHDDAASWPAPDCLVVRGLEYKDLEQHDPSTDKNLNKNSIAARHPLQAGERVRWLSLQKSKDRFDPQAWVRLSNLFKERGEENQARWVLLGYRVRLAVAGHWLLLPVRVCLAFLSWEPLLVLIPFLLILYCGAKTYQQAWDEQLIRPTAAEAWVQKPASSTPPRAAQFAGAYPYFNPWIYTLENELPLAKFGMDDKWAADPNLIAQGKAAVYWRLAGLRWFLILAGWAQGILLTLGINRRFHD
jgi:hypothetical protein